MYELIITESYKKKAKKFFAKQQAVLDQYEKVLTLLCLNPQHPSLRCHKLGGSLSELHSVSINISYRLIIYFVIDKKSITLVDIGSHDQVY